MTSSLATRNLFTEARESEVIAQKIRALWKSKYSMRIALDFGAKPVQNRSIPATLQTASRVCSREDNSFTGRPDSAKSLIIGFRFFIAACCS
jgi:hypothetical protein